MISVEFRSIGPGTCQWCRREKEEVAHVAFSDKSFVGAMCWKDLQRALSMKCPGDARPAPAGNGSPASAK